MRDMGDWRRDWLGGWLLAKRFAIAGFIAVGVPVALVNKERLAKLSKVGVDSPMALGLPAIVVVDGIPDC